MMVKNRILSMLASLIEATPFQFFQKRSSQIWSTIITQDRKKKKTE